MIILTRHGRRDRVVVLRAERVVYFDFLREFLNGETGQTAAAEFFCRRRVHLHVARGCQDLFADVQHAAGNVQVIVCNEIAAHFSCPSDAFLERRACRQIITILIYDHIIVVARPRGTTPVQHTITRHFDWLPRVFVMNNIS